MSAGNKTDVARFLGRLQLASDGFQRISIRYIALVDGDTLSIIQGHLRIEAFPEGTLDDWSYACGDLRAGHFRRGIDQEGLNSLLKQITSEGRFELNDMKFAVTGEDGKAPTFFYPSHIDTSPTGGVFANRLRITGASRYVLLQNPTEVDAQLRAAELPFQSLNELQSHIGLSAQALDHVQLEIGATTVAEILQADAESYIDGGKAKVSVLLSSPLSPNEARLGWRALVDGVVVARSSVSGETGTWEPAGLAQKCCFELDVPPRSVVECFLSFRGRIQHDWWLADPRVIYNPRRVVHEAFDPKLERLEQLLFDPAYLKSNSRKFEEGVTYLLAMLGFRATRFDSPLADAPDIVVSTAAGDVALIECCTSAFDPGKLTKLAARAKLVRAKLDSSAHHARRVVAIAVTSLSRADIEAELQVATRMGIVVVAAENLRAGIPRTLYQADPHLQIYEEAVAELAVQGQLPLEDPNV